jgi:hypothetical protein
MEISSIYLKNLRNEEHYKFQTDFAHLVTTHTPATLGIETQFDPYQTLLANEGTALDVIRKSATTEQIFDSDTLRDETFSGLAGTVKSMVNHYKAEVKAAAARLQVVFGNYNNVAVKPYDEETAAITKLVADLQGNYSADVAIMGLTEWVAQLQTQNEAFDTLKKARYTEEAAKTQLKMKETRTATDVAYHAMVKHIDALIEINGETAYSSFVNELNTYIDSYNNLIAQRQGRNAKNNATTAQNTDTNTAK